MLQLKIISGPDKGRAFDLSPGKKLVVGRGDKSDTQINDPSVSRVHFEVAVLENSISITDLGSSSGTFVDNTQIKTENVEIGNTIRVGDSTMQIIKDDGETTIAPGYVEQPTLIKPLKDLVGVQLGPYMLDKIVGTGNSGMMFKATDSEKNRVAAVKVLSPQFTANDGQRQRFVRAMKTMLPIKDERIVKLFNAGKNGPYCWAAMEFVDGDNLAAEIENIGIEGMMDWKKVWRVAVDIGRALQTGFENKIVHRNVTPINILRRKSDGACLLGDFMLAKALEGTLAQQVTQPGQILGDIPYLAPERTKADADVDTRSDLYGLGATCYALLTGRPPISGDTMVEMIANVRDETPAPPKNFQLSTNELFQDVVLKLLAKDPDQRFANPTAMLKELLKIGKFNNLDAGI